MRKGLIFAMLVGLVVAVGLALTAGLARAGDCTVTVTAPASIQAAVDAAGFGDVVCLSGTFNQSVVFGPEDSGITLTAAPGAAPVLDGTGLAAVEAIRLLDGVSDVTIEGLEIQNYTSDTCCGQGNAIQAWGVNTSNIVVRRNNMHDNNYSAILVGSEGAQMHTGWAVHGNIATNNATGFFSAQIELTNCSGCSIHRNNVTGGIIGILVQGRNTIPDSGLVETQGVSVKNNVVDSDIGVYILGLASGPLDPFPPIVGAQADLLDVTLVGNQITSGASWVYGYLGGQIINPALVRNDFNCNSGYGIGLFGNTFNAKVVNNDFANCAPDLIDGGYETKHPPVPDNPS